MKTIHLLSVLCCSLIFGAEAYRAFPPPTVWPEGKKAAFYLSFDDACPSQITNVFPRLEKYRIPATFYVCPQWPLFKEHERDWTTTNRYVTLGNHTYTHGKIADAQAFEKELVDCNREILRVGADKRWPRTIAFGVPGAESVHQLCAITDAELAAVYERQHVVQRLPYNGYPTSCTTVAEMETYIDAIIAAGEVGHLDFHGVGGDWLDPGLDYFEAVLKKLDARRDDLWLAPFTEIHAWRQKAAVLNK